MMRRFVRASLSSSITSPRDLATQSSPASPHPVPSTNAGISGKSAAWVTETTKESLDNCPSHWLVLIPYRFYHHGFNFDPIVREFREGETRIVIKRHVKGGLVSSDDVHASEAYFTSRVVSRNHAEIWCEIGGDFCIRDVSSSSGTFLNGERLSEGGHNSVAFPLKDGDIIELGVEVDDGIELVDRAVKIRAVIGHGSRRMRLPRRDTVYKPAPVTGGEYVVPSQYGAADSHNDIGDCGLPMPIIALFEQTPTEPTAEIASPIGWMDGGMTSKTTLREDETPSSALDDTQPIIPPTHNPLTEESAPPRYRTPSPVGITSNPERIGQLATAIQSSISERAPPADLQAAVHVSSNHLTLYASKNRHMISPELERKLIRAHYLPVDNPDEISPQEWHNEYGVGHFELKRLRQLYARNFGEPYPD